MISMRHARCPMRLNKDELELFSTRCHLYNGASIKKHSSVMLTTDASHTSWGVTFENQSFGRKETTHQLARTENSPVGASEFSLLVMRRECKQSVL